MKSIKKEITISLIVSIIAIFLILVIIYKYINSIVIHQKIEEARLESRIIYNFREYLAKVSPKIRIVKDNNLSPFACTPAYVVNQVAKLMREKENLYIRQVSDRWRDPNDKPNKYELKAIKYFETHPKAKEFWQIHTPHTGLDSEEKHIFYAYPLYTEKSCLVCHGVPYKQVPSKIYHLLVKYYGNRAFNYKVGELRGIISIRIPFAGVAHKIKIMFFTITMIFLMAYIIGMYIFLKINRELSIDITTILNHFKKMMTSNRFSKIKENLNYKEMNELKRKINDTIEKSKKYYKDIRVKFYLNPLTNLPNRNKFFEYISKNKDKTIMLINVDKFREINSFFDTRFGDELVRQIAKRLNEISTKYGLKIFHLNIDEFALISDKCKTKEEIEKCAEEILNYLEKPYDVFNHEISIKFRMGISFYEKDYIDAEMALSIAKENRKDIMFDENSLQVKSDYGKHIIWLKKLKSAIEDNRIVPFYQPIVDKNCKIVKYEALVRMIDEDGKVISPFFFLDVAKKSRLYLEITKIVIQKAFKVIKEKNISISVNLTLEDIESEDMREFIISEVRNCVNKEKITFEIVENEDVRESELVSQFMKELQNEGCQIYIDDFGSGYSNFDYLLKLNPNGVKIDGSLIKNILENKNNQIIVKTIINFAKETGIKTVAEFVENKEIFDKLREMGIDYYQGYYFSPPQKEIKETNEIGTC